MSTTEMINPPPLPSVGQELSAMLNARPPASKLPTVEETPDEIVPLAFVVPVAGPPVIVVLGPLLFIVLLLIAPAAS
jgi:hypothetical protein